VKEKISFALSRYPDVAIVVERDGQSLWVYSTNGTPFFDLTRNHDERCAARLAETILRLIDEAADERNEQKGE